MAFRNSNDPEILDYKRVENLAGGRLPMQEAVHRQSMKYIRDDYKKNAQKYSFEDRERISNLLAEDSSKK